MLIPFANPTDNPGAKEAMSLIANRRPFVFTALRRRANQICCITVDACDYSLRSVSLGAKFHDTLIRAFKVRDPLIYRSCRCAILCMAPALAPSPFRSSVNSSADPMSAP